MGDGHVALILDVHGLAQRAGVLQSERDRQLAEQAEQKAARQDTHSLLLFGYGDNHRMALPLSEIARLEEIPTASIERTGRFEVVQYRDRIMPLIRLAQHLDGVTDTTTQSDLLQVIVYAFADQYVGIVVDRILDVTDTTVNLQRRRKAGPILGSAVIQDKVTDILDLRALVGSVDEEFVAELEAPPARELLLNG